MNSARVELQKILETCVVDDSGNNIPKRVYFTPGEKQTLNYPCIVYSRRYANSENANNSNYNTQVAYWITIMSTKSDDTIQKNIIKKLPSLRWQNEFTSDGINHSVFLVYYRL